VLRTITKTFLVFVFTVPCQLYCAGNHTDKILARALDGLEVILRTGKKELVDSKQRLSVYAKMVQHCGGVQALERLQDHKDEKIVQNAVYLLNKYFEPPVIQKLIIKTNSASQDTIGQHQPQQGAASALQSGALQSGTLQSGALHGAALFASLSGAPLSLPLNQSLSKSADSMITN
jgi:hypothetical protein